MTSIRPTMSGSPFKPTQDALHTLGRALKGLVDGKVTFGGYHADLPKAKPDTMAALLASTKPPFSALATNVKHHANGVTSYDITAAGPKFAYQVQGLSHFEVAGAKLSVVEVKIGPDKESGAKSVYAGRAFQVFGVDSKGKPFAAELWDDVNAENAFVDVAANLHNGIVDGSISTKGSTGGFRGLAASAGALDAAGKAPKPDASLGRVGVSDRLLKFVGTAKNIPGLSADQRAGLLEALKADQAKQAASGGWGPK